MDTDPEELSLVVLRTSIYQPFPTFRSSSVAAEVKSQTSLQEDEALLLEPAEP